MTRRQHRAPLLLTDDEANAIAEFRWRNRIQSQAEAARQLIRMGLEKAAEARTAIEGATSIAAE